MKILKKNRIKNLQKKVVERREKLSDEKTKNSGDQTYYQIEFPNKKKYWINASYVRRKKFITIFKRCSLL